MEETLEYLRVINMMCRSLDEMRISEDWSMSMGQVDERLSQLGSLNLEMLLAEAGCVFQDGKVVSDGLGSVNDERRKAFAHANLSGALMESLEWRGYDIGFMWDVEGLMDSLGPDKVDEVSGEILELNESRMFRLFFDAAEMYRRCDLWSVAQCAEYCAALRRMEIAFSERLVEFAVVAYPVPPSVKGLPKIPTFEELEEMAKMPIIQGAESVEGAERIEGEEGDIRRR